MSKNLSQIFATNPVATIGNTDLFYMAQSGTTDGAISGLNLKASFLQVTNNLSDLNNVVTARSNLGLGTMATQSASSYLALAGGTMAGTLNMGAFSLTNLTTPVSASDATTKSYVDGRTAGGAALIPGVFAASTANLTGYTYNNGTAGVGATLTAPSNGVFALDGFTIPVGYRWLYKDDSTGGGAYNGVYVVTTSASGVPAVSTRASDYNSTANMLQNRMINVLNGTINGSSWYMQTSIVNTVGTDAVTYSLQFAISEYVLTSGDTMTGALTNNVSVTSPKFTLQNGTAQANTFTWQTGGVFPYFGNVACVTQNGPITAGHYAIWGSTAIVQDGGVPGQLLAIKPLTATTPTAYAETAGTRVIKIYAQGAGGGGGGGGQSGVSCGSGGDSGALVIWEGPVTSFTYQCGIGGTGGVGTGTGIGVSGTNTTVTAFAPGNLTAQGGTGGASGTSAPGFAETNSTVPTASGGNINIYGQRGNYGVLYSTTMIQGGNGGDSYFGLGGQGQIATNLNSIFPGGDGVGNGTGGGGAAFIPTGTSPNGGNGQNGIVYVFEYS